MAITNDVEKFLQAIFPDHDKFAIFANAKYDPGTKKLGTWQHCRSVEQLDDTRDCFLSPAAFLDDGVTARTGVRVVEVRALVIDDVGTPQVPAADVLRELGSPTFEVRTSAGSAHWWYALTTPVPKAEWLDFFEAVERLVGHDLDGAEAHHVFRIPMGVNTKAKHKGFKPCFGQVNPGVKLNPAGIRLFAPPKPVRAMSGGGGGWAYDIEGLARLIPNTFKLRKPWVDYGYYFRAAAIDDDAAWRAFDLWSHKWHGYDGDDTEKVWRGIKPKGPGLELHELAEAADPAGYKAWHVRESQLAFDDGVKHPEVPPGRGRVQFKRGAHKEILATKANAELALTDFGITCAYDEFHHRAYIRRGTAEIEKLSDRLVLSLRGEINKTYGKDFGNVHIGEAIMALAYLNGFNPVTDMLSEAEKSWDGVKRLDQLGPAYFHTEDTKLARRCFRKVMIAAVRRARKPGVKFDQILVLESPEGWDKSSAWAVLAGEGNFSDADILGKDAKAVQEELADIWIHEIADLSGLAKAEIERVKSFASRVNDRARPAYGRVLIDQPRQSIEVGTTNADVYLLSPTGNRRFWTFRLRSRVDIAALRRDRLQLWGEAAAAESTSETLELDRVLWNVAAVAQEERRVVDPWEDELANLDEARMGERDGMQTITNLAIHDHLGGHRGQTFNSGTGRKLAEIMKRLGWQRTMLTDVDGKSVRGYQRARRQMSSVIQLPSVGKKTF